jgi:hypothetical protein
MQTGRIQRGRTGDFRIRNTIRIAGAYRGNGAFTIVDRYPRYSGYFDPR